MSRRNARPRVIPLTEIEPLLASLDLLPAIERAFARYSAGEAVVPPVGELLLDGGDVHIKYGYLKGDPYYVIKVASGFYGNPELGLPSSNGMMLLFEQRTGRPVAVLLDEGRLTDARTGAAGAVAAKYLAPRRVQRIGIVGTGTQARMQLECLMRVSPCRRVLVWGRGKPQLERFRQDMSPLGFEIEGTHDAAELLAACNVVVTTTPSTDPILFARDLRQGTHLTCVGADTADKQEVEAAVLGRADLVVADSVVQCRDRGEIHHALADGVIAESDVVELGNVVAGRALGRTSEEQITLADLTGVAVQDIAIAEVVFAECGG